MGHAPGREARIIAFTVKVVGAGQPSAVLVTVLVTVRPAQDEEADTLPELHGACGVGGGGGGGGG